MAVHPGFIESSEIIIFLFPCYLDPNSTFKGVADIIWKYSPPLVTFCLLAFCEDYILSFDIL